MHLFYYYSVSYSYIIKVAFIRVDVGYLDLFATYCEVQIVLISPPGARQFIMAARVSTHNLWPAKHSFVTFVVSLRDEYIQ